MEQRALFSLTAVCDPILYRPRSTGRLRHNPNSPIGSGYTPANIHGAYGISSINIGGVAGTGAGQTIAIIDAYNDPNILSDVAAFNSNSHDRLAAIQRLRRPDADRAERERPDDTEPDYYPNRDRGAAERAKGTTSWAVEESLDVEWAHSIAPQANIILFEANSDNMSDLLTAVQTAADYSGVSVVSMSWGTSEFSGETSDDSYFTTPSGHANVTFLASTGDSSAPGEYPAYSPNVIAVGGTTLTASISTNAWQSETGLERRGGRRRPEHPGEPSRAYQDSRVTDPTRRCGKPPTSPSTPIPAAACPSTIPTICGSGWASLRRHQSRLPVLGGDHRHRRPVPRRGRGSAC